LVERVAVAALALCTYWSFRRRGSLEAARAATTLALFAVLAVGLLQHGGRDLLAALDASDQRGSFFGNANMGAQYAGLAALFLLPSGRREPTWRAAVDALLVLAAGAWIVLLLTRSVLVALGAGVSAAAAVWLSRRAASRRQILAAAAVALAALGVGG